MIILINLTCLLLAGIATASPAYSKNDENVKEISEFNQNYVVKHESQHDIVNIVAAFDFRTMKKMDDVVFFFVEADVDASGKRTYRGLFVFKNNTATKLLENGRDIATSSDDVTQVFFGAKDGLYVYKKETNEAVKYGSVTDNIIGIAKTKGSNVFYILTEDHELYKVTDEGNTKTKVDVGLNPPQIVIDHSNNLYFYDLNKQFYVLTNCGVKKIIGLPANPNTVHMLRPFIVFPNGVPILIDNIPYTVHANGSSAIDGKAERLCEAPLTAISIESFLLHYYACNKKIYEYNATAQIADSLLSALDRFPKKTYGMDQ